MQKIINAMAVASFVVSAGIVGGGVYLYTQKDAIVDNIKEQVTGAVTNMFSGSQLGQTLSGGAAVGDVDLGVGDNPPVNIPNVPF